MNGASLFLPCFRLFVTHNDYEKTKDFVDDMTTIDYSLTSSL